MNLRENISLAIQGLVANKMRALLTMLGIIIGIGSVIAISSVGNAMTGSITSMWEDMGLNNIGVQVAPRNYSDGWSMSSEEAITTEMIDSFEKKYADKILGIALSDSLGSGTVEVRHEENTVRLTGVNDGFAFGGTGEKVDLAKGRFVTKGDERRSAQVAVISENLAAKLYPGGKNPIGQDIKVDTTQYGRLTFKVVGTYKEKEASAFSMGSGSNSTTLYMPLSTMYYIQNYSMDGYFSFYVAAKSGIDYQAFAQEISEYFDSKYYAKNKTNHVDTQSLDSMVSEAKGQLSMVSTAISVIAAISLLVGGIGVMNIMLVSVTERTREIGIRKALGAPNSAIRVQFIVESVIICAIGGILGILLGGGLGGLAGALLQQNAIPSVQTIVIAVAFSMLIGVFFGYYPANKAAKLDPIEALRYE